MTTNPYLTRTPRHGQKSERRVVKKMGARRTIASGATDRQKGDGSTRKALIEAKATVKRSYSVKQETLEKLRLQALQEGKYPVLAVSFVTGDGRSIRNGDFVVLPLSVYQILCSE